MKRVGSVVGVAQGVAVVRAEDAEAPDLGTSVVDEQLDAFGTVVDVIGPVERPYLAVTPDQELRAAFVGNTVYART